MILDEGDGSELLDQGYEYLAGGRYRLTDTGFIDRDGSLSALLTEDLITSLQQEEVLVLGSKDFLSDLVSSHKIRTESFRILYDIMSRSLDLGRGSEMILLKRRYKWRHRSRTGPAEMKNIFISKVRTAGFVPYQNKVIRQIDGVLRPRKVQPRRSGRRPKRSTLEVGVCERLD